MVKLELEAIECIEYNMLNLAVDFTKHYIGDLVLDFKYLEKLNEIGFDENNPLIFIVRDCGTELGYACESRIGYYLNPLIDNPYGVNKDIKVYAIDIKALSELKELTYCQPLYGNNEWADCYNVMEKRYENQTA